MNVVSKSRLKKYWGKYSGTKDVLLRWYYITRKARWNKWKDVRIDFPSADKVGDRVVFNIKEINYRLIVVVRFFNKHIYLRWFGTHSEYDKLTKKDIDKL